MVNSVKIRDVAASAGVSIATVSYVMNGKAEGLGITPATRQRVLEAVKRTGYRPNQSAREMALGCLLPAGQEELLSCQVAELPPAERVVGCQVAELPPAERVVGCQVAELLGDGPNGQPLTTQQHNNLTTGRDSAATQQHNNLTTILAAAGYSLVPVASVNDLSRLPGGGIVGVLYKATLQELPQTPHPGPLPQLSADSPPHPGPLPQGERVQMARVQNISQGESDLLPLPLRERVGVRGNVVTPQAVQAESSPSTPAPEPFVAATDVSEVIIQPPNNAADTAATTEETPPAETPVVTAACGEPCRTVPGGTETGEITLVVPVETEPEVTPPSATQQLDNLTTERDSAATQQLDNLTTVRDSAATQQPDNSTTGRDSADNPTTFAAPPAAPPSATEQPDNSTTCSPSPSTLEPESQADRDLSSTTQPFDDAQGKQPNNLTTALPPEPPPPDPVAAEPVVAATPSLTTQQPSNLTTALPPEPEPSPEPDVRQPDNSTTGRDSADNSTTFAAPTAAPSSATEQPNNSTTGRDSAANQ